MGIADKLIGWNRPDPQDFTPGIRDGVWQLVHREDGESLWFHIGFSGAEVWALGRAVREIARRLAAASIDAVQADDGEEGLLHLAAQVRAAVAVLSDDAAEDLADPANRELDAAERAHHAIVVKLTGLPFQD